MSQVEALARRPLSDADRPLAPVQWAVIVGSVVVGLWSLAGLIANPDFAIGESATSARVLGVDMNGWHAVSGFLIAVPGLVASRRRDWSFLLAIVAAVGLIATGVWALIDIRPFGVLYLPEAVPDALLHFATAAIFTAGAFHRGLGARSRLDK
jgi:hypothetical protein